MEVSHAHFPEVARMISIEVGSVMMLKSEESEEVDEVRGTCLSHLSTRHT